MESFGQREDADLVVGLDCGTTSTKAIAFDRTGKMAAYAGEPVALNSPQPNYYEQDPVGVYRKIYPVLKKFGIYS